MIGPTRTPCAHCDPDHHSIENENLHELNGETMPSWTGIRELLKHRKGHQHIKTYVLKERIKTSKSKILCSSVLIAIKAFAKTVLS